MGASSERLLQVIDQIYGTCGDDGSWTDALTSVSDLLGGTGAYLIYHNHGTHSGDTQVAVRTDPEALAAYRDYYHRVDPWATSPAMPKVPTGKVYPGHALVPRHEMVKTEYYADFGKRYGLSRMVGCMLTLSGHTSSLMSLNRGERHDEFGAAEVSLLQSLAPHVLRALQIRQLLEDAAREREAVADVCDRLGLGIVVVDSVGHVAFANVEARRLAALKDGFLLERDGPRATVAEAANRLRAAMHAVQQPDSAGEALLLPRRAGSPLQLLVLPSRRVLQRERLDYDSGALLILRDPARPPQVDPELLRVYFGLTPSEARFAAHLAAGSDVSRITERLRLTRSTGRWLIEQLRTKLGVRTQAQLVGTISASLARLRNPVNSGRSD